MKRTEKVLIEKIVIINPILGKLQDKLEREQSEVIKDLVSPAKRVIERLMDIDRRRVDLCNLNVLYGFIRRELGDETDTLPSLPYENDGLFDRALTAIGHAGYDADRVKKEFGYLLDKISVKKRGVLPLPNGDRRAKVYA